MVTLSAAIHMASVRPADSIVGEACGCSLGREHYQLVVHRVGKAVSGTHRDCLSEITDQWPWVASGLTGLGNAAAAVYGFAASTSENQGNGSLRSSKTTPRSCLEVSVTSFQKSSA